MDKQRSTFGRLRVKLLIDTNALLWTMNGSRQLSRRASLAIQDLRNEAFVSVGSIWEAAIKYRSGRLPQASALLLDTAQVLLNLNFTPLPLQLEHAKLAGCSPIPTRILLTG